MTNTLTFERTLELALKDAAIRAAQEHTTMVLLLTGCGPDLRGRYTVQAFRDWIREDPQTRPIPHLQVGPVPTIMHNHQED